MLEWNPEYVLHELYAAYAAGDLDGALSCCTDDVVFATNIPHEVGPLGGEAHGRRALRDFLVEISRDFELVFYRPGRITIDSMIGHAQVRYCFRHRVSRMELDGVMRHEIVFENRKVACIREYHDIERVRAFMQLVAAALKEPA